MIVNFVIFFFVCGGYKIAYSGKSSMPPIKQIFYTDYKPINNESKTIEMKKLDPMRQKLIRIIKIISKFTFMPNYLTPYMAIFNKIPNTID